MSKIAMMKREIGQEAFRALGLAGVTHSGAVVVLADGDAMARLRGAGVVGPNDGLTIVGSGLAMQAQKLIEDELF
jgi:sugar (pentulose or hexulose) kinase